MPLLYYDPSVTPSAGLAAYPEAPNPTCLVGKLLKPLLWLRSTILVENGD
jgi:hypothetical protein